MKLKVWKRDERARLPERSSSGSVGFDLFALEDSKIPPGKLSFLRTGLVVEAEPPYAVFVFPRSSLFKKKGLIFPHSAGIIDFDYCGEEDELKILVLNIGDEPAEVFAGEKIAQLVLINVRTDVEIEVISRPPKDTSRGGFGSTGGYK